MIPEEIVKVADKWRRKFTEFASIFFGAGLLLILFKGHCLEFSNALEAILIPVEKAIVSISQPFISASKLLLIFFNFPQPQSSVWETIFAVSIFHQLRTFAIEVAMVERRKATIVAMLFCFSLGGTISYSLGVIFPLSSSLIVVALISFLYAFLEFVRYSVHAWLRRASGAGGVAHEFRRRNRRYTIPYFLISIAASITAWVIFRGSEFVVPVFAILLFLSLSIYLIAIEIIAQLRRKKRNEAGVRFLHSTVTQTALQFIAIVGLAIVALRLDQRKGLIDLLWACRDAV